MFKTRYIWWRPKCCHLQWLPRLLKEDWQHTTFKLHIAVIRPWGLNVFSKKRPQPAAGWLSAIKCIIYTVNEDLSQWIAVTTSTLLYCLFECLCASGPFLVFLCILALRSPKEYGDPHFCGWSICGLDSFPVFIEILRWDWSKKTSLPDSLAQIYTKSWKPMLKPMSIGTAINRSVLLW